jgi:hypothetical protein
LRGKNSGRPGGRKPKLIVLEPDNSFAGTVDALDIIAEVYEKAQNK